jgi:hypothetical protein
MQRTMCRAAFILAAAVAVLVVPGAAHAARAPVSSHAMLYTCCTPPTMKGRIFAESRALGAGYVRVDVELSAIFGRAGGAADWRELDRVIQLSRQYSLPVDGIILSIPPWLSSCPNSQRKAPLCAPRDIATYGELAGRVAAHARGTIRHWEIGNEPDESWAFKGGPESYARMLASAHDAIKRAAPEDQVLMGGVGHPRSAAWAGRVFGTPGAVAARKFDIGSVHVRGPLRDLASQLRRWRRTLSAHGFHGPIWVTEHGYPSERRHQDDPHFRGGPSAQAAFLRRSIPLLAGAGADQVFVTLRDNLGGRWASEGVLDIGGPPAYAVHRKAAFDAIRRLTSTRRAPEEPLMSVGSMVARVWMKLLDGLIATLRASEGRW